MNKEKEQAQIKFKEGYNRMGISQKKPTVLEVLENKHGIDNPVIDLNTTPFLQGTDIIFGDLTIDLSNVTGPQEWIAQDESGYITLQAQLFSNTRVPFSDANGLLTDDADMTFTGDTLTVSKIKLTNTGLQILDTNATHYLSIVPGSNITAARTLTLTTGDADRTISLSANLTLPADPNANRLFGWDDTDNATTFITLGTGLSYDHSSHTLNATVTAPGGSNTQLQFNNGGTSFGGAKIDYTEGGYIQLKVEDQTVVDTAGYGLFIYGSAGKGTGNGGWIELTAGRDELGVGYGADLYLEGSPTTGKPNSTYLSGTFAVDGDGGDLYFTAGGKNDTGTLDGHVGINQAGFGNYTAWFEPEDLSADRTFTFPDASGTFALETAASGSFTTVDLKTVTVVNGIITSIV